MRRLTDNVTLVALAVTGALIAILAGGCGFGGKRGVNLEVNILGSTVKWSSTADGAYRPPTEGEPNVGPDN
jgi:hypothetical protein